MNIMGWRAVVLSGREVGGGGGGRVRGDLCAKWGEGAHGMDDPGMLWKCGGAGLCARWEDGCAHTGRRERIAG